MALQEDIPLDQIPYDPTPSAFFNGDNHLGEITQSSLQSFLRCPQKFTFRYMMMLTPKGLSIPLLIGGAVHDGLEVLLDPDDTREMTDPLRSEDANRACDKVFEDLIDRPDLTFGREAKIDHARAVAAACMEAWWVVHADSMKGWIILRTEMNVRSQPNATCDSPLEDRMAGKLDGLLRSPEGQIFLLEHKTRQNVSSLDVIGLELDIQVLWYFLIALAENARNPDTPVPTGLLYDAIQKPQHRLNAKGWEDLRTRMIEAMVNDPQKYFRLEPLLISSDSVRSALQNFRNIIQLLDRTGRDQPIWKNLTACNDYGGCPYRSLCFNHADANYPDRVLETPGIDLYTLTVPHPELS